MRKTVVICEKPSQARNVRKAVGGRFGDVLAARGHLYELAEPEDVNPEWRRWSGDLLMPEEPFPLKARKATGDARKALGAALRRAERAIIATDCDREGHLIGSDIIAEAGFRGEVLRAEFSAEDPGTLRKAFSDLRPAQEFEGLRKAGMARRQADQIVNLTLTRAATTRLLEPGSGAIGIGRVRTPTLAIVCMREKEIREFRPEMRYAVAAETSGESGPMRVACRLRPGTKKPILDREEAQRIAEAARGWSGNIAVSEKPGRAAPPKPFDLSSLQQAMGSRLKWPAAKTLGVAQKLYAELMAITYPRAECRAWPEAMIGEADEMRREIAARGIAGTGEPGQAVIRRAVFSDKALEGSSHHAIAPNLATAGEWAGLLASAGADEKALFEAIARRTMAATSADRRFRKIEASLSVPTPLGDAIFAASGEADVDPGWTAWEKRRRKEGDREGGSVPPARDGERRAIGEAAVEEKPAKPPPRYGEGEIIAAMRDAWKFVDDPEERERLREASGIGTPATRDRVIETLVRQGQLRREKGRFSPTEAGYELWRFLTARAPETADPATTARWEARLDGIQRCGGEGWWRHVEEIAESADRDRRAILGAERGALAELDRGGRRRPKQAGKGKRMNGSGANGGAKPPSEKQVAWVRKLAGERGMEIGEEDLASAAACSARIDELKAMPKPGGGADGASKPPSERQVAWARKLAGERGVELGEEDLATAEACSKKIDELKAMPKAGDAGGDARPPSEKQVAWARKLAGERGVELGEADLATAKACSNRIDELKAMPR